MIELERVQRDKQERFQDWKTAAMKIKEAGVFVFGTAETDLIV